MIRTAVLCAWAVLLAATPATVIVRPGAALGGPVGVARHETHSLPTGDQR